MAVASAGHVQVCTSLQTDSDKNHTPAPHHSVFYRPDALPAAQPTVSKPLKAPLGTFPKNFVQIRPHFI